MRAPTVVILPRMSLLQGRRRFSLPGDMRLLLATSPAGRFFVQGGCILVARRPGLLFVVPESGA